MAEKTGLEHYPYNLLIAAKGRKNLALPLSLTKDVQAGLAYALFTLEETEREVLDKKFRLGLSLSDNQQQTAKKALKKLCHPCRWDYIYYGVVGCVKKKTEEAWRKGFEHGYQEGYVVGLKNHGISAEDPGIVAMMDLPIETMPISSRVCNALRRSGCKNIRDVATQNIETIQKMRNLGEKGIEEVSRVLHSYGLIHTAWELF